MCKNYWQPNIDNWIINENDVNAFAAQPNQKIGEIMAGGSHAALPIKSEEEEDQHDKLENPYRGIKTLQNLKKEISRLLNDLHFLSNGDVDEKSKTDVYEIIIKKMDDPDLRSMLDIASQEVKKRKDRKSTV